MIGHRLMGNSLLLTGDIVEGRVHLDRALALYSPDEHRPIAMRFGQDAEVSILAYRALALWVLGYPEAALRDANHAVKSARAIGQAATLMYALSNTLRTLIYCEDYATAIMQVDEVFALADEKRAAVWKATAMMFRGLLFAVTGEARDAVRMITSGLTARQPKGSTNSMPLFLSYLARAYTELGQFDDAWRCIDEAMTEVQTTKERWCEADVHRAAGEIALMSPECDTAKAEAYFERALAVAREQQAKSWELRAAISIARLWRDQGKRPQAHNLLASIYGWFTEGFDTPDLKEAEALLDRLK
jgi:predicted ATPase